MDIKDITSVSTTSFDDRIDNLLALLRADDPDYNPGVDPEEERYYILIIGDNPITEDEINSINSKSLRFLLREYNSIFHLVGLKGGWVQIFLQYTGGNYYRLWLEYAPDDTTSPMRPISLEINIDLVEEFLEVFNYRFYDIGYRHIPEFVPWKIKG